MGISDSPGTRKGQVRPRRAKRSRRRLLFVATALVLCGGAASGLTVANQVSSVRTELAKTIELVPELRAQLSSGDVSQAKSTLASIQVHIHAAESESTGALWKATSYIPWVGANFRAVTDISVSAADVVDLAAAPLISKYEHLNWSDLTPKDGQVQVQQLEEIEPVVTAAASAIERSYERLDAIDTAGLIPEISEPLGDLTAQLDQLSDSINVLASAAQVLPSMLGVDEPRRYLVLVQNNAETRATGGIPGALAIMSADKGRIDLSDQTSASAMGIFDPPLTVDEDQESVFTRRLGTHMQNVNLTPDFVTAASTAKQMWEFRNPRDTIDGVVALDPIVLARLLSATGPLELDDPEMLALVQGTQLPTSLTAANVVPTLLSDVYREIEDPSAQDLYFASVASTVFGAFSRGTADSSDVLAALSESVSENRLLVWSAQSHEQAIISRASISGSLAEPGTDANFGVYFNDGTGAKMDFYARRNVQLIQMCKEDGYSEYKVRLSLLNDAPSDAAATLPAYVTGGGAFGVEPGSIRTNYVVYGPAQSVVAAATVNGSAVSMGSGQHRQRPVGTVTVQLLPGETAELEMTFVKVIQGSAPTVRITPTVEPASEVLIPFLREGPCL